MNKITPEIVKLMKGTYKEKYFGESMIARWHGDFKNVRFSAELAYKAGRPESFGNY